MWAPTSRSPGLGHRRAADPEGDHAAAVAHDVARVARRQLPPVALGQLGEPARGRAAGPSRRRRGTARARRRRRRAGRRPPARRTGRLRGSCPGRYPRPVWQARDVQVLVTGGAGFIGGAVVPALLDAGPRGAGARRAAARGAPRRLAGPPRPARRAGPRRRARPAGRGARRRRRGLPPGGGRRARAGPAGPAAVRRRSTSSAPRCCSPRWTARASAGWCWPARWSCTARAATAAPSTASSGRCPAREADLRRGPLGAALPGLRPRPGLGPRARGRAGRPAQRLRRHQDRAGAPRRVLGARQSAAARRAALPQRLRPAHAARTRRTPGWRACSAAPSPAGEAPRVYEDGGQQRDFVHVARRRAGQPARARRPSRSPARCGRTTWPAAPRTRSATSPPRSPAGGAGAGGHRAVPARRRAARRRLARSGPATSSASPRRSPSRTACASSSTAPLRGEPGA